VGRRNLLRGRPRRRRHLRRLKTRHAGEALRRTALPRAAHRHFARRRIGATVRKPRSRINGSDTAVGSRASPSS
jgi:hypothetical protein